MSASAYVNRSRSHEGLIEELLVSLRKTLAAAWELHGQGIGCPDCPDDAEESGEACPMLLAAETTLAKAEGRS